MSRRFQRTVEDFTCAHCGASVMGTGYTNHCPECLWSRHVDVNPGDRAAECKGLMKPIRAHIERDVFVITQRCIVCKHERRNKAAPNDNPDTLRTLVAVDIFHLP